MVAERGCVAEWDRWEACRLELTVDGKGGDEGEMVPGIQKAG